MAGTEGNATEMNVLKTLVNTLAQSVQTLAARQAAPTEQLKKSVELTSSLEYQQRCLKRERDCDSKRQGIVRQQNLLDELQTRVRSITATVETAPAIILLLH
jgi:flagellar biosynthesis/type III secretory pathway chaperone